MNGEATDKNPGVRRLFDMVVEEVSLVDRPANKRRFIVVKRGEHMAGEAKEVHPDGKGGLTAKAEDAVATTEPTPENVDKGKSTKADQLPAAAKTGLTAKLQEASDRILSTLNRVKNATEGGSEIPADLSTELQALATMVGATAQHYPNPNSGKYPSAAAKGTNAEGEGLGPDGKPIKKPKEPFPGAAPPFTAQKADEEPVEKGGAKMAKERFARLADAVKALSALVSELSPPEPEASAGAAQKSETPVQKSDVPAVPPAPVTPNPAVEKLGTMIETLAKSVAAQQTRLDQILTAQPSNTVPVEKKDGAARDPNEVSWPADMNRDFSRGAVAKEVSFHTQE